MSSTTETLLAIISSLQAGERHEAARQAESAYQAARALPDSPLGQLTTNAIARICKRCRVDAT